MFDQRELDLSMLRRLGFDGCASLWEPLGTAWEGTDPRATLAKVWPELAAHAEPIAVYRHRDRWNLAWRITSSGLLLGSGPPNPSPTVSEEWEALGWSIPDRLARLYAVHDGIGPIDGPRCYHWRDAIVSAAELVPVSHRTHFGEARILYRPEDLLMFAPDGRGGGQCFERVESEPDPWTRGWDALHHEVGDPEPFDTFLARLVARWTGQRDGAPPAEPVLAK